MQVVSKNTQYSAWPSFSLQLSFTSFFLISYFSHLREGFYFIVLQQLYNARMFYLKYSWYNNRETIRTKFKFAKHVFNHSYLSAVNLWKCASPKHTFYFFFEAKGKKYFSRNRQIFVHHFFHISLCSLYSFPSQSDEKFTYTSQFWFISLLLSPHHVNAIFKILYFYPVFNLHITSTLTETCLTKLHFTISIIL